MAAASRDAVGDGYRTLKAGRVRALRALRGPKLS